MKTNWTGRLTEDIFVLALEGDKHLVYAPLERCAFVANVALVQLLQDLERGILDVSLDPEGRTLDWLRKLGLVDPVGTRPHRCDFDGTPSQTSVTLFLTTTCGLRCTYCYASAGDTKPQSMTLEVAKRGIDFVFSNARKGGRSDVTIAYHGGGEPTANWSVLTESWEYAIKEGRRDGINVFGYLATNGVLSRERAEWLALNLSGGTVSFDGIAEVHDANRPTVAGKGSSYAVSETLRLFDSIGFRYGIRMTITRDQLHQLSACVEHVCKEFSPTGIQVEPVYQLGRWEGKPSAETSAFIDAFRGAHHVARKYGYDLAFSGARAGTVTNHFCGVTRDTFALTTEGSVSACYEVFSDSVRTANRFVYGRPSAGNTGYDFNMDVLNKLRDQTVETRGFCDDCFAKWSCAGDCYHKLVSEQGTTKLSESNRCHIIRELTKDQLLRKIESAGGLFWHEPPS